MALGKQSEAYYPTVYGLWTNKGGVGKTTLAFHLSTTYAALFPEKTVLAIDMCPQCNLSSTLLTYSSVRGEDRVSELIEDSRIPNTDIPRTVGGFLMDMTGVAGPPQVPREQWEDFFTNVHEKNQWMPKNLHLLCGERCLDVLNIRLSSRASEPGQMGRSPFVMVHNLLRRLIGVVAAEERKRQPGKEVVVFIDTNPAITMYTQVALCAMTNLIVPINADDYSLQAVRTMYHQVYGLYPVSGLATNSGLEQETFAYKAKQQATKLELPKITCIVHNRAPISVNQAATGTAPKAFEQLCKEQADRLLHGYTTAKNKGPEELERVFMLRPGAQNLGAGQVREFRDAYTATMKDMTSCGIASTHTGVPLWMLKKKQNVLTKAYSANGFLQTLPTLLEDLMHLMKKIVGEDALLAADEQVVSQINNIISRPE